MGAGSASRPRVGIGAAEREADRIRSSLEPEYALVAGEDVACDVRLIGPHELTQDGAHALRNHRSRLPDTPVIVLLPGEASGELVRDCYRHGALDVLAHEEIELELRDLIVRTLERARGPLHGDARGADTRLGSEARVRKLEHELSDLREGLDRTLGAVVTALDYRERETGHHSHRVALYATFLGGRLELGPAALENLFRGALLHDIGKLGTPESLLLKSDPLSKEEWETVRQHAEMGAAIITGVRILRDAADVPMSHHEAWNGQGYPRGLREHEIPLAARIFAVVDTYDAVRSARAYRPAEGHERAIDQLRRDAGRRLDPSLVELFCREPESTWTRLDKHAGSSLSFEGAVRACSQLEAL